MHGWLQGWVGRRRRGGTPAERQAGAIPYVVRDGVVVFLLITSRRSGRWIFPKGGLIEGLSERESAAREAWEEAGVRGRASPTPVGTHRSTKVRDHASWPIEIALYPLEVTEEARDWPEKTQRRRRWVGPAEACDLVKDRALARLVRQTARIAIRSWSPPPAATGPRRPAGRRRGR